MEIQIRKAAPSDLQVIYDMICDLEETSLDFEKFSIIFFSNISKVTNQYLVAVNNQNVITGMISCHIQNLLHHTGAVAEIMEFFVRDTYRNTGTGSQLLTRLEEITREQGCVSLEVTAQNKRSMTHRFYLNKNFKQSHLKFTKTI